MSIVEGRLGMLDLLRRSGNGLFLTLDLPFCFSYARMLPHGDKLRSLTLEMRVYRCLKIAFKALWLTLEELSKSNGVQHRRSYL
jgi:hypothetical protein